MQLKSLAHLKLVINRGILLSIKVGHRDLQLVRLLVGQQVESLKANPALSLQIIRL